MPLGDGPHQRRRAAPGFLRIDVGTRFGKHPYRVGLPGARRHHQRGVARRRQPRIRVGAGLEQPVEHRCTAVDGSELKRRHGLAGSRRHAGPGSEQQVHGLEVVPLHGPVERRRAVNLREIDVGLACDRGSNRPTVAAHRRVGHFRRRPSTRLALRLCSGRRRK